MAQSHTGDYHDNMDSDTFTKWVEGKLVPIFERRYPGKKMELVADNAPYHHKRAIGSLGSKSEKQLLEMAGEHGVEYVDLPLTNNGRLDLAGLDGDETHPDVQDKGDHVRVNFLIEEQ